MNALTLKLDLKRYPHGSHRDLQAWDSADELILHQLNELELPGLKEKRILVANDAFGALSSALEDHDVTSYTDSYLSFKGIQLNSKNRIQPLSQIDGLSGIYDYALVRIPKNMSFLEDMLCHLSHHLHSSSKIICGYMIKHQAKASFDLINKYIGKTTTSLAQKKARLIFADFQRAAADSPFPLRVPVEGFETPFINHSNLFSREKLDMGTRFFLDHIPQGDYKSILDLGCANGIVGIAAKKLNPAAKIMFSDESFMAIQSAHTNYENYFSDLAEFHWTHCFENQPAGAVDLVLCNPPFHQGHTLGDATARQMFEDSYHCLVDGGTLQVIGNSHLPYPSMLKRIFGNSQIVATNKKFLICRASK